MFRYYPILLIGALLAYAGSTASIISAKRAELRYILHHATLLNYELSGRTLTDKLWRRVTGIADMEADARGAALERAIFAEDEILENPGLVAKAGIGISNLIRLAKGEPLLNLDESRGRLQAIRAGFRLETRNQCEEAIALYTRAQEEYDLARDELAFTLVHRAFCYAMIGDFERAIADAARVRSDLYDSRHANEAATIESLLSDVSVRLKELRTRSGANPAVVQELFRSGDFRTVAAMLGARSDLSPAESLMLAQAYEYTGETTSAVREYLKLLKRNDAGRTAVLANRRLLYISKYSGGGDRLEEFATDRARELDDDQILEKITQLSAATPAESPLDDRAKNPDTNDAAAELAVKEEMASIATLVNAAEREKIAERLAGRLVVVLSDGRRFDASIAFVEGDSIRMMWGDEATYAPIMLLRKVERSDGRPLTITYADNRRGTATALQRGAAGGLAIAGGGSLRHIRSVE